MVGGGCIDEWPPNYESHTYDSYCTKLHLTPLVVPTITTHTSMFGGNTRVGLLIQF